MPEADRPPGPADAPEVDAGMDDSDNTDCSGDEGFGSSFFFCCFRRTDLV